MADQKIQTILRLLVWSITIVMIITIILAWWQYPEPYEFFQESISSLGGYLSTTGLENKTSSIIFTIGISICGIIAFIIAIIYFFQKELFFNTGKAIIALFIAIGTIGIAIPRDYEGLLLLHAIGAAIFIGAFGIFNGVSQLLRYSHKHRPKKPEEKKTLDFYLDLSLVYLSGLSILIYLILFILHSVLNVDWTGTLQVIAQKMVLIISFIATFFLDKDDM
ncbi:MAG: hypothetical protein ACTSPA_04020 [Promethearchaeota archaeon]